MIVLVVFLLSFQLIGLSGFRVRGTMSLVTQRRFSRSQSSLTILPSKDENELFGMLRKFLIDNKLNTTVRVAGGWVRDKILNTTCSDDIDLAVDDMTGLEFAISLHDWQSKYNNVSCRIGVMKRNPEKSKHLETATMSLLNKFQVDFVKLRSEVFTDYSRIPSVRDATPMEDANRRDLTINSLFYNLRTCELEDFTGRGLKDLKEGLVRTPLSPLITLADDPLRTLRTVRFACRLNFRIDDELAVACGSSVVCRHLHRKVSRERLTAELGRMLAHDSAPRALVLLWRFGVLPVLLPLPHNIYAVSKSKTATADTDEPFADRLYDRGLAALLVSSYITHAPLNATHPGLSRLLRECNVTSNERQRSVLLLAALTSSASGFSTSDAPDKRRRRRRTSEPLAKHFLQDCLRLSTAKCTTVLRIQRSAQAFESLIDSFIDASSQTAPLSRLELGLAIREARENYPLAVALAASTAVIKRFVGRSAASSSGAPPATVRLVNGLAGLCGVMDPLLPTSPTEKAENRAWFSTIHKRAQPPLPLAAAIDVVLRAAETLCTAIDALGLARCYEIRPLFGRDDVRRMFPRLSDNAVMQQVMAEQWRWQIVHPNETAENSEIRLRQQFPQYL